MGTPKKLTQFLASEFEESETNSNSKGQNMATTSSNKISEDFNELKKIEAALKEWGTVSFDKRKIARADYDEFVALCNKLALFINRAETKSDSTIDNSKIDERLFKLEEKIEKLSSNLQAPAPIQQRTFAETVQLPKKKEEKKPGEVWSQENISDRRIRPVPKEKVVLIKPKEIQGSERLTSEKLKTIIKKTISNENSLKIKKAVNLRGGGVLLVLDPSVDKDKIFGNTVLQNANFEKDAESDNAERIERVQKVCSKYNLGLFKNSAQVSQFKHPPTPQYSVFYIDIAHKLAWCPVYKAASSSMLHNLCLLGGQSEEFLRETKQQLSTIARKIYPELDYPQAEEALQSCLKVIIVRHPFERLLSAYRDKLENVNIRTEHGSAHFYKSYGSKIVERFRVGGNNTRTQDILRPGTYYWDRNQPEPAGVEPTFQEFVRYLINTDLLFYADDHWIPYYLFCTPCLLKYDVIAKVESFFRDQMYIIRALDAQNVIKPTWKHQTKDRHFMDKISKVYFSQLTRLQIEQLHNKYRLDFELFDYAPDAYYNYVLG